MEDSDNYIIQAADRQLCPDLQWCFRLYYKTFRSEYGPQSGDDMINTLQEGNAFPGGTTTVTAT